MATEIRYPDVEITVTSKLEWTIFCKEYIDPYNGQSRLECKLAPGETVKLKTSNTLRPCGGTIEWLKKRIETYPVYYGFMYSSSPYGAFINMIEENNGKSYVLYPTDYGSRIVCKEVTSLY
jgi:hypothetical protein